MKKGIILTSLVALCLFLANCQKNDDGNSVKLRDYQTQYDTDIADIEQFLKTHSYEEVIAPGTAQDGDVIFHEVPENDATSIFANADGKLTYRMVEDDDIEYKLYYLKLREGGGIANDKPFPCNVDAVLAAYSGTYLFHLTGEDEDGVAYDSLKTNEFETNNFPQTFFNLESVVKGWSEIFPQFKGGDHEEIEGQPTLYTDFGAGVMFIPSGLGYYNGGANGSIPSYSPLIFTFKLFEIKRLDQDADGIPSYLEDHGSLDGGTTPDRYIYITLDDDGNPLPNPDDTDNDGPPDYLDLDDDGDQMLTKRELQINLGDDTQLYDFFTVPDCSGDATNPDRLRRHLDPACAGSTP
ncbi:MAG: FKBP-type peptidylprolyl isomerase [Flavobacterium sp.]|uniref:FKBP-type peptidyl-prolyl cis-trans isomerase n=1 Tax=Flavobacterium sp. TaxID=239 RepID=UPI0011F90834|nr:FKBP-type peptidylprolyl isomerase [Flavobacterium sp.]RZJ64317.1 MAG: FKBP-type peptidylprolyl isomerase [Flavobacterium sp.]